MMWLLRYVLRPCHRAGIHLAACCFFFDVVSYYFEITSQLHAPVLLFFISFAAIHFIASATMHFLRIMDMSCVQYLVRCTLHFSSVTFKSSTVIWLWLELLYACMLPSAIVAVLCIALHHLDSVKI